MQYRTVARELALQALYQEDIWSRVGAGESDVDAGGQRRRCAENPARETADPDQVAYAHEIVDGVLENLVEIDRRIAGAATNWRIERLACVDRNVLRLALWELLYSQDVPPKVVIDEAINLAKKFSTQQSGAFVNGVLDRIYRELRAEDAGARGPSDARTG